MTTTKRNDAFLGVPILLLEKSKMLSLGGTILFMLVTMCSSFSLSRIGTIDNINRHSNYLCLKISSGPFRFHDSTTTIYMSNIKNDIDRYNEHREKINKHAFDYGQDKNDNKGIIKNVNNFSSCFGSSRRNWLLSSAAATVTSASTWSTSANAAAPTTQMKKISLISSTASCDSLVSVWKRDGRIIYLLGSAHISKQSAETAGQLVRDTRPDAVFVELDIKRATGSAKVAQKFSASAEDLAESNAEGKSRQVQVAIFPPASYRSAASASSSDLSSSSADAATSSKLTSTSAGTGNNGNNNDPPDYTWPKSGNSDNNNKKAVAASSRGGVSDRLGAAAVGGALRGMYKKLDSAGFDSGGEFIAAMKEGTKVGSAIVLGDQDVDITLSRLSMALKKTDFVKLLKSDSEFEQSLKEIMPGGSSMKSPALVASASQDDALKQEFSDYVETIKAKENVKKIMDQLKKAAPALYEVMVSERDWYMAAGLDSLNDYKSIVAVMGVAHIDGVERNLRKNGWRDAKLVCPPTTASIA